jgi:hypothetical protein
MRARCSGAEPLYLEPVDLARDHLAVHGCDKGALTHGGRPSAGDHDLQMMRVDHARDHGIVIYIDELRPMPSGGRRFTGRALQIPDRPPRPLDQRVAGFGLVPARRVKDMHSLRFIPSSRCIAAWLLTTRPAACSKCYIDGCESELKQSLTHARNDAAEKVAG